MTTPNTTPKRSVVRNGLAGVAIGTAALVGGLTVLPSFASAQETEPETTVPESTEAPESDEATRPSDVLDELVAEGVITQAQADTITERMQAARAEFRTNRGHRGYPGAEVVTELLGLTQAEIREAFQAGTTLAELAEAQGIATDDLVDALVAEAEAKVAEKLEAGDITQERADSILDGLEEKIEDRVTAERPIREGRRGRGGPPAAEAPDA